jgi:hypothetical protein
VRRALRGPSKEEMTKRVDRRELSRKEHRAEIMASREYQAAWASITRQVGGDAPDGPFHRAYLAGHRLAGYWKDRALRAKR